MDRLRKPALLIIVAVIVAAGTWPDEPAAENQVAWREPAPGLWFEGGAQAISAAPIRFDGRALTLELWIETTSPPQPGNQEIASFIDGPGVHRLLLGRYAGGLLLRGRADNPGGDPRLDHYVDLEVGDGLHHLAVTVGPMGTALHLDGRATGLELAATRARPDEDFGGKLLLGSSDTGWAQWRGAILAVAIHRGLLAPDQLARHAALRSSAGAARERTDASSGSPGIPAWAGSPDVVALYLLDEGGGRRSASTSEGAPELLLPVRLARPTAQRFLRPLPPRWSRSRWQPLDLTLNVVGFVPLGIVIAWKRGRRGFVTAVACALALSLAIELVQPWIPGRNSALIDLVCNGLGGLLGAGIAAAWGGRGEARAL